MPEVRLRITASVDANLGAAVFAPIVSASKRAKKEIEADWRRMDVGRAGAGGGEHEGGYRTAARRAGGGASDIEREVQREARARVKAEKAAMREIEAELAAHNKRTERERQRAENRAQRIADASALRVSGGTVRNMGAIAQRGAGVAGDIARGAGIDFSLGNAVKQRQELERLAVQVSNSGFMKGDARNGARVDPRALMAQAQQVGIDTASDPNKIMEGISAFTGKTGDLSTAREVMGDLAMLAKATGSNMEDLVSAAGDVSANLGDIPNKGAAIGDVMKTIAGQGKLGAVEIKDLAKDMAKLASAASLVGGDRQSAMGQMGALAQVARQRGGSASAQQAATSVQSFVATFDKGAREKEFKKAGVTTRNADGTLRAPQDIILDSLKATGGNSMKMGKLFMDVRARSAVKGFEAIFREAGGGDKGLEAVKAAFGSFTSGAKMGDEEIKTSFGAAMNTGGSKAQVLKNKIEKDLGDAVEKAAPNLMKLGDLAGKLVGAFGSLFAWAAENPLKAAFAAMTASMAKSIGSELMRAGVERVIGGSVGRVAVAGAQGTVLPPGGPGKVAGGAATFGAALAITATAVTLYSAGTTLIDKALGTEAEDKLQGDQLGAFEAASRAARMRRELGANGPETADQRAAVEKAEKEAAAKIAELEAKAAAGEKYVAQGDVGRLGQLGGALVNTVTGGGPGLGAMAQDKAAAEHLPALRQEIAQLKTIMGRTLKVEVTNQPGGSPGIPPGGRTGP